jgi:hypothetical protein
MHHEISNAWLARSILARSGMVVQGLSLAV